MKIDGKHFTAIWLDPTNSEVVQIIDQRYLPFGFQIKSLSNTEDFHYAIQNMLVRGAPLIGTTAAFGMYIACVEARNEVGFNSFIERAAQYLKTSRPTAVDLFYAIDLMTNAIFAKSNIDEQVAIALETALNYQNKNIQNCLAIGTYGKTLIEKLASQKPNKTINILTHCNAGWLATDDYGTATAPIYLAHDAGLPVHIWVDETRPRNQGARLTAWELAKHGVPHTVISDNAGGHLMQHGLVDMVIVGSDRTTRNGDVANKIGTYLKALAAYDNNIPFYVALPSSTIDWSISDGIKEIPIEERSAEEVKFIQGLHQNEIKKVQLFTDESPASNFAFDVTPAKYVTALITERGICSATEKELLNLFPEQKQLLDA